PLEGSTERTQNLSLGRWIVGWVAVDTSRGEPTRAHILGIPGALPLKPGFVQVRSLPGQKLELVLGDGSGDWSRLEIAPVDGAPAVVGTASSSWVPVREAAMRWDFNSTTPLVTVAGRSSALTGGVSLRAVDAYQAIRFVPGSLAGADSVTGPGSDGRWGLRTIAWIDSLPEGSDSGFAVLADLGSGAFTVALQADGRLRLSARRGTPAITAIARSAATFRLETSRWTELGAYLDRSTGFALWVDGQKVPLDAPSVDTGAFFAGVGDLPRLVLGASATNGQIFPGALRDLSIHLSAPYVWN
ncbi:MAG TPA: hypothetical protein PKY05_17615, partial [Fibrobacteria bacterium]|nr:hypothetical protein [Fibrobacteria bacterium]